MRLDPVQIGGIQLGWRRLAPELDLSNITLFDETGAEPVLTAGRLSLGFSLWRLVQGEVTPARATLSGLSLTATLDEQGRLRLADFETRAASADHNTSLPVA